VLVGLTSLVFSAMILGFAVTQEHLDRIEAKLDAAIKARAVEEPSARNRVESAFLADRPRD
jgi:hypothetical protein